jgi:hypothetical protein
MRFHHLFPMSHSVFKEQRQLKFTGKAGYSTGLSKHRNHLFQKLFTEPSTPAHHPLTGRTRRLVYNQQLAGDNISVNSFSKNISPLGHSESQGIQLFVRAPR